jgi:hypothetical protein
VSIFGAVFILAFAGWAWGRYIRSSYATGAEVAVDQPVPFSHQHHVAGLGIDCRYCHGTVEESRFAGMPSTKVCMNCHSQIWLNSPLLEPVRASYKSGDSIPWVRVHNLADFVYFNHSIHVKKGVGCSSCHGPVHEMPLMRQYASLNMEWCLQCHRNPEPQLRPQQEIYNTVWLGDDLQSKYHTTPEALRDQYRIKSGKQLTDCSVCHR